MMKKDLNQFFKNFCCSKCSEEFNEKSIDIVRQEEGLSVLKVICKNCSKSFGLAILGLNPDDFGSDKETSQEDRALDIVDTPCAISYDDVIEAHNFIRNLDENWSSYIKNLGDY